MSKYRVKSVDFGDMDVYTPKGSTDALRMYLDMILPDVNEGWLIQTDDDYIFYVKDYSENKEHKYKVKLKAVIEPSSYLLETILLGDE